MISQLKDEIPSPTQKKEKESEIPPRITWLQPGT